MRANALSFIEQRRAEAHRLGWTAEQLFSMHPETGTLRVDHCGAVMASGSSARGV